MLQTRFAPTPSGLLHIGNAFSFALTWLLARSRDGRIRLRIDDMDAARKRPEYLADIFRTLDWLQLDYDDGPSGPDQHEAEFSQHLRIDLYRQALEQLRQTGRMFACPCSRSSIRRANPDGQHPPDCRSAGHDFSAADVAWRVNTDSGKTVQWQDANGTSRHVDLDQAMRDFVVRKKNGEPAYQITSLVDDHHYGINYIVRGVDLLDSTAAQRWLGQQLPTQPLQQTAFWHHDLVCDDSGNKLSKSAGTNVATPLRETMTAEQFYRRLASWLQLPTGVDSAHAALHAWREQHGQEGKA